jgi:hypothetical protein
MSPEQKGKTLWEMLQDRLHRNGDGGTISFANPLDLRVGSAVPVAYANGPEFAQRDFAVQEIREYNRHLGDQDFRFTDYVLRGINPSSIDANDILAARLRVVPNQAGAHDSLLLRLFDEFAFAEDFLNVLKDDTGIFEVADDDSGPKQTFTRINNLRDSYEAAVLVVAETTPDGKAAPGKASPLKVEYWDYWRDALLPGGQSQKEFLFAEMNSSTGWFQLWRGREFFS